jgi:Beta propeller domain
MLPYDNHAARQTASILAVLVYCLGLAACGGGGASSSPAVVNPVTVVDPDPAATSPVLAASGAGDLLSYVRAKILQGAGSPNAVNDVAGGPVTTASPVASPAPAANGPASVGTGSPTAFAGTRLQELGVDEDDLVKTDGTMLYALVAARSTYSGNSLTTTPAQLLAQRRLADGQLQAAGSITLGAQTDTQVTRSGIYLASSAQRIAVLGYSSKISIAPSPQPLPAPAVGAPSTTAPVAPSASPPMSTSVPFYDYYAPQVSLEIVNLSTTAALTTGQRLVIDGQLVGSRMIGNQLYVVSTWSPNLLRYYGSNNTATASLTTADILPTVQIDGAAPQPLLRDTDCYVQAANKSRAVQITTITAFDLASVSLQRTSRCFVGGSDGLYMSPENVYITSSRYYTYASNAAATQFTSGSKTDVHKFELKGPQINYKGSGEVPGHLGWDKDKLPYRMSEYQGDLRVLSFTGQTGWTFTAASVNGVPATSVVTNAPASPATLTILRQGSNSTLQAVGSLPNSQRPAALGKPGEQVYGVQFVGGRAYVVTFRRTDPLYVLDVSNPVDPKALGELEMPGFSDYLVPMGDKLLLGVGKDASSDGRIGGVKVALMNVANPAQPRVVNSFVIGKAGSTSGVDASSHGLNIFQQGNVFRIALPVRVHETPSGNSSFFNPISQGLYRFEVDTTAGTLISKPSITATTYSGSDPYASIYGKYAIDQDRAMQIDANIYYFTGGQFMAANW